MKLLVVNVNTTQAMTDLIGQSARQVASENTEIIPLTPRFGAESVEGNFESYLSAVGVMDCVQQYQGSFDAIIQAGYGEHGREGLQELFNVPVIDITEAAASTAIFLGHQYSVITTLDRAVPLIENRLLLAGFERRCASVRATGLGVLELEADSERAINAIIQESLRAINEDKAEVICLGCGGMSDLQRRVQEATGVPVIDGVTAAVKIAESLVQLGLQTSKIRTYAQPHKKKIAMWPLG
ncbi:aspartate/glutamate racemase family protein [Paenalcaligenes niemegkensis]|uniref:aspartate/glutamate racemase family protein n=1 Tax=Paenalcaligenes niemegkensis TaxID=2895469 RepID=UPI001EE788DF|nr:aspartate/glutamate racemase family protein [Paenalcaligenes niemegkensis]MCQ9617879.1 aspartate/glutamate racemase family protein [Paenalcaligenes niemegkensis]